LMGHLDSIQSPRECVQCLYRSTHPFGLQFNSDGLCTGCITHREKFELDWDARFLELQRLVARLKRKNRNRHYDCVVPIRGTPEYFYVMDVVKNRLGLNPLAVSYNSQFNSEVGIQNIDRIRDTFDVDILVYTSNALIYKKLIRESLVRFSNMRWPFIAGESVFPVQVAVERDIPLVVWPYHQATEQVGMHSYTEAPEMSRRYRSQFDLLGFEPEELTSAETLLTQRDVWDLRYPTDQDLVRTGLRGIYLSNYLPWDTRRYSEEMINRFGALGAKNPRTFDTYDRIDDMTYMSVHDVLKFRLHGYSRVTDNLCREIRFGRISIEDARAVEAHFQVEYPAKEIEAFLHWLGMKSSALDWYVKRLPHHLNYQSCPALTPKQQTFVASFTANGGHVINEDTFITYGKGLYIDD
jgi:N-acetyl sugar amidotransferase